METVPVLKGSAGLNNKVDPARLRYDSETGIQELAVAKNVDIGDSGRVSRRKGYSKVLDLSDCHSIYNTGDYCLFVHAGALAVLEKDYSYTNIRNVTVGANVSYVQVEDKVYYCNGHENGYVKSRVSYPWVGEVYVGPTTTKTFSDPPVGHLVELFSGRIYIASDSVLWYTEPFAYSWVDFAQNFIPFESKVRMIEAVDEGLWVSDSNKVYFLRGKSPKEFEVTIVTSYPAIEGTTHDVFDIDEAKAVVWTSTEGICMGFSSGKFKNLTRHKLWYPDSVKGAGLEIDGKYICALQP